MCAMNKFYVTLVGLALAVSSIVLFNFLGTTSNAALPRDCDDNSIIYCGGITASELAARYKENKTGDLDNIYADYGLSAADMTNAGSRAKMGEVRKNGDVVVNGKVVATQAQSLGRKDKAGSHVRMIGGKKYYERAPSVSFESNSIVAYVFFDANGDFRAAVLTSCGNPVTAKKPVYKCDSLTKKAIARKEYEFTAAATANNGATITNYTYDFGDGKKETTTAKTVKHLYEKAGTYTAKLSVNMNVAGTAKVVTAPSCQVTFTITPPVYSCDSLTTHRIERTKHSFTGKASASNGATIVDYTFDFGDGVKKNYPSADVEHTYAKDGNYTTIMTVNVKADGVNVIAKSEKCKVQVVVNPDECKPGIPVGDDRCKEECKPGIPVGDDRCKDYCKPGIPVGDDRCKEECKPGIPVNDERCEDIPAELPKTGPMDMIAGTLGLGALVAAAYYWYASRRGLMIELLKR